MRKCSNCGASIADDMKFCEQCGTCVDMPEATVENIVEIKEVKKESNTFAIVAICLSGVCCLIYSKWLAIGGIVLGIVGLAKAKEYAKPRRGLALTAIIIGAITLVINIIVTAILSIFSFGLSLLW